MTMLEKVAQSMADAYPAAGQRGDLRSLPLPLDIYQSLARAAIEAMREPDDAMRLASKRYKRSAKVYSGPACYRAMIDAALSDEAA